jgi:hypothetical protein
MSRMACVGLLLAIALPNPVTVDARTLTLASSRSVVPPADSSGVTTVALDFDVSPLVGTDGLRIQHAFLEWSVEGADARNVPEFTVREVTGAWDAADVGAGRAAVSASDAYLDSWTIDQVDYDKNGPFVRLELTDVVQAWVSDTRTNHGLLLSVVGVDRSKLIGQVAEVQLVIWYTYRKN